MVSRPRNFALMISLMFTLSLASGCASVSKMVHDATCPQNCHSIDVIHEQPYPPDGIGVNGFNGIATPEAVGSSVGLEEISTLKANHVDLQEQFAKFDDDAKIQRSEASLQKEQVESISKEVKEVRDELDQNRYDLNLLRTTIDQQRAENERVLAALENQLVELLAAYEGE